MQRAERGAHFVWVNDQLHYPRELAEKIGRDDLKIVSPDFFSKDRWRGIQFTEIVIDHAAYLNDEQHRNYHYAVTAMIRRVDSRTAPK